MSILSVSHKAICEQIECLPIPTQFQIVQSVLQSLTSKSELATATDRESISEYQRPLLAKRDFGFWKSHMVMREDFDEPLDCMKEYME